MPKINKPPAAPVFRLMPSELDAARVNVAAVIASLEVLRKSGRTMARTLRRIYGSGKAAAAAVGVSNVYWSWINIGRQVPSNDILRRMADLIERNLQECQSLQPRE